MKRDHPRFRNRRDGRKKSGRERSRNRKRPRRENRTGKDQDRGKRMILSSSMAEHSAVNRRVVGSSPT